MRTQQVGTERTIEPNRKWLHMTNCRPERLDGMPGQIASGHVGNGHRNHQRHVAARGGSRFLRCHRRAFGVKRIEDCLNQQKIYAAVDQRIALFAVHVFEIIKVNFAIAGVVDVG